MKEKHARLVAVVVSGDRNDTRITYPTELTQSGLDWLAQVVAEKDPSRIYNVVAITKRRRGFAKGDVLYQWHVGEGFEHHEGWWIDVE
jgi:hypothetical protein